MICAEMYVNGFGVNTKITTAIAITVVAAGKMTITPAKLVTKRVHMELPKRVL